MKEWARRRAVVTSGAGFLGSHLCERLLVEGAAPTTSTRASFASSTPSCPRMRPNDGRAIPTFIRQALHGEAITVAGDRLQTRSVCYVDDLIEDIVRMLLRSSRGRSISATCRSSP